MESADEFMTKLIEATGRVNQIPKSEAEGGDFEFYLTDSTFRNQMHKCGARILEVLNMLLNSQSHPTITPITLKHSSSSSAYNMKTAEDLTERFIEIIDVLDVILEKVDSALDEGNRGTVATAIQQTAPVVAKWAQGSPKGGNQKFKMIHAQNILRPQLKFEDKIDNSNKAFIPKIKSKPNAIKPLDLSLYEPRDEEEEGPQNQMIASHLENMGLGKKLNSQFISYPHPYEYEINHIQYPSSIFAPQNIQMYLPLDSSKVTWVDTVEELKKVAEKLEQVEEIAIDLEHHSYRSFMGFVCLMQISTRQEDFLIDTLKLRSQLQILNSSFTNPKIAKVLHGADSDIVWLQKDFGVYIVNLFDTGQAARVLEHPALGLAHLLNHYCSVQTDKKYQLADWRIRPLPTEMFKYAREDTHYLLYIYDRMRNELIGKGNEDFNLLKVVLKKSEEICLKKFEKEFLFESSHRFLSEKYNLKLNETQQRVFQALFSWRDTVARDEDESTAYVLPNHMLIRMAQSMPTDSTEVIACCNPVPPLVRMKATDIAFLIDDAIHDRNKGTGTTLGGTVVSSLDIIPKHHDAEANLKDAASKGKTPSFLRYNSSYPEFKFSKNVKVSAAKSSKIINVLDSDLNLEETKAQREKIEEIYHTIALETNLFAHYDHLMTPTKAAPELAHLTKKKVTQSKASPLSLAGVVVSSSSGSKNPTPSTNLNNSRDNSEEEEENEEEDGDDDDNEKAEGEKDSDKSRESAEDEDEDETKKQNKVFVLREMKQPKNSSSKSQSKKRKPENEGEQLNESKKKKKKLAAFDYQSAASPLADSKKKGGEKGAKGKEEEGLVNFNEFSLPTTKKIKSNVHKKSGNKSVSF